MLLAPVPWAGRVWALPSLTALVPSERCCRGQGRRHKTLVDVGRQMALQARRWLPDRDLVLVADSGLEALLFLDAMRRGGVTAITRPAPDAALYEPAPPRPPGTIGRPRKKGARLPTLRDVLAAESTVWRSARVVGRSRRGRAPHRDRFGHRRVAARRPARRAAPGVLIRDPEGRFAPQALLCTDPARDPAQIVAWFVRRWQVEVTFQEVRARLRVETQRQWSDKAIARTTPCLLALFSIVALLVDQLSPRERRRAAATAWYAKPRPTARATPWPPCAARSGANSVWSRRRARGHRTKRRLGLPEPWAYALCHTA